MAMAAFAAGEDLAGGNVQRSEQGGGFMADVAMSYPFDIAQA